MTNDIPGPADASGGTSAGCAGAGEVAGRRPGRPRSEAVDRAVLDTAADLLVERGIANLSIELVAERAHVGKATIYRRWPNKRALALDAFLSCYLGDVHLREGLSRDRGSLRADLRAALRAWRATVQTTRAGTMLTGLLAEAQRDPELAAAWRARVLEPVRQASRVVFERAASRGELDEHADVDLALDLAYGAVYHRLLHGHLPIDDRFLDGVADVLAAGLAPRGSAPRR